MIANYLQINAWIFYILLYNQNVPNFDLNLSELFK